MPREGANLHQVGFSLANLEEKGKGLVPVFTLLQKPPNSAYLSRAVRSCGVGEETFFSVLVHQTGT